MRAISLGVAAALLAGCSLFPPAGIQTIIPASADSRVLPVTVVDHGAVVAGAAPAEAVAPQEWARGEVQAVPGRDDAVVVSWVGGSCDDRAVLTVSPDGERYAITVDSQTSASGCDAVGRFRSVLLTLTKPAGADAFEMSEDGG